MIAVPDGQPESHFGTVSLVSGVFRQQAALAQRHRCALPFAEAGR
jgi:hypothetical protein